MNLSLTTSNLSFHNTKPLNPEKNQIKYSSEDTQMSSSPETHINNNHNQHVIHDSKTLNVYHKQTESANIIKQYGRELLSILKIQDQFLPFNYLSKQPFLSSSNRMKLLINIFKLLKEYHNTNTRIYFLTVYIIDTYIYRNELTICQDEIDLIMICSLCLASKMEDTITMNYSLIENVVHEGKYTKQDIICKEKEIVSVLDFELLVTTSFDYIDAFLYDFEVNNEEFVMSCMKKDFQLFKGICMFLCKLATLSEEFSTCYQETIAICVLAVGYDLFRNINIQEEKNYDKVNLFLHEWINFILNQSTINKSHLKYFYDKLVQMYEMNSMRGYGKELEFQIEYED